MEISNFLIAISTFFACYFFIGFIVASITAYLQIDGISSETNFCFILWPLVVVYAIFYYPGKFYKQWFFWLRNREEIHKEFMFLKKAYLACGNDAFQRETSKQDWIQVNAPKLQNELDGLRKITFDSEPIIYVKDYKFTKQFYKKMNGRFRLW